MEKFKLKIVNTRTSIEKDRYENTRDSAHMTSIPKIFSISFECVNLENMTPVYFTHRFKFTETISKVGGMYHPEKKESDFVLYLEGQKQDRIGGIRMDEKYFTQYGDFISKYSAGEEIWVEALSRKIVSRVGREYIKLNRVKLDRSYYYHAK